MTLSDSLMKHEGLRLKPYTDSVGKLTIGIGHNLEEGISEAAALFIFSEDVQRVERELETLSFARHLNEPRRVAILNMLFNLGLPRFLKFKRTIAALEAKDWDTAAREMMDSKWAAQVGFRAKELAQTIKRGV